MEILRTIFALAVVFAHSPWNSGYDVDSEWARWASGETDQIPDGEWYGNNPLNDPFFVSDNGFVGRPAECLQIGYDIDFIEKHIEDVIKDHRNDTAALEELQQSLSSILIDLQMEISSYCLLFFPSLFPERLYIQYPKGQMLSLTYTLQTDWLLLHILKINGQQLITLSPRI